MREFYARSRRLASALAQRGIGKGDTVSVMLANTPPMLEAHYGVPMTGAVLHAINTRLDAAIIAFMLDHAEAKVLIADREFAPVMKEALALAKVRPLVIDYDDPEYPQTGERLGTIDYEDFLAAGDPDFAWSMPDDEWDAISLNYTSGTTGNPKGVVYHHRGAALLRPGQRVDRRHAEARGLSLDAADVPLQRLVLSLVDVGRRRHPCLPPLGARRRRSGTPRRPWRHPSLRRADRDVDDPVNAPAADQRQLGRSGRVLHRGSTAARSGARRHGATPASTSPISTG